jgi:uncharacterized protein (DUF58 family)
MKEAKKIFIKSRKNIFGEYIGNNNSLFNGEGFDFHELREYQIGDDIKKIDWMITAKLQKPHIKEYFEQRQLNIVIVNILGASTHFGTKELKNNTIANINALISFIAIKNHDNFSSMIYADKLYNTQKPTKKEYFIHKNIENILSFDSIGKKANYEFIIRNIYETIKKKSIIFIISDFLENVDLSLLSVKHEVVVIIVRDRIEDNMQALGNINLINPNTKSFIEVNIDKNTANNYNKIVKQNDLKLFNNFTKRKVKFLKIYTDENIFLKLANFFSQ